jgi:hypothetical protein
MISKAYISGMITILSSIMMLPEIEAMIKIALIVSVILIALLFNLFFFWNKLQEIFLAAVFQKFLLQLYKSDDFIQFLSDRQKKPHHRDTETQRK